MTVAQLHIDAALHRRLRFDDLAHPLREQCASLGDIFARHEDRLHRLQVDVDTSGIGQLGAQCLLESCAGLRRCCEGHVAWKLRVHGEVERAVALTLDRHVVKVAYSAVASRRRVNALDQIARLRLPLDEHREVELRQGRAGRPLDVVDQPAGGFEWKHSRGGDAGVA